jgi:hypothetical protein
MARILNSEFWAGIGFFLAGETVVAAAFLVIAIGRHA